MCVHHIISKDMCEITFNFCVTVISVTGSFWKCLHTILRDILQSSIVKSLQCYVDTGLDLLVPQGKRVLVLEAVVVILTLALVSYLYGRYSPQGKNFSYKEGLLNTY